MESLYVQAHEPLLELVRKLAMQYSLKIKANPDNAAYNAIFKPQFRQKYASDKNITDSIGIFINKEAQNKYFQYYCQWDSRYTRLGFKIHYSLFSAFTIW